MTTSRNAWTSRLGHRTLNAVERNLPPALGESFKTVTRSARTFLASRPIEPSLRRVRPYTMTSNEGLLALGRQVRAVLADGIPGDFVECGVWRGGAAFLMADLLRQAGVRDRKVWLFDSFEGLPPPQAIDGASAIAYATSPDDPRYLDNCRAMLDEVRRGAEALGLADRTELVQGWFEDSLPKARERVGPIAILRIDADWYSSVRCCLESLYDQVSDGGYVIFDDYDTWDGCAIAAHEFLGTRKLPHRIERDELAYFRKA